MDEPNTPPVATGDQVIPLAASTGWPRSLMDTLIGAPGIAAHPWPDPKERKDTLTVEFLDRVASPAWVDATAWERVDAPQSVSDADATRPDDTPNGTPRTAP